MTSAETLESLLARSAMRDANAFERLYQIASPKLFGLAVHLLKRKDLAEDVLQEAFVKIWHNASSYHPEKGSAMVWMTSIVRYRALDVVRSKHYKSTDSGETGEQLMDEFTTSPLDELLQDSELKTLVDCMDELQETQKKSILLAFYEGNTHHELAEKLKVPLGTVKSWIRRGLDRVKRCLKQ